MVKKFISAVGFTDFEQVKQIHYPGNKIVDRDLYVGLLMTPECFQNKCFKSRYVNIDEVVRVIKDQQMNFKMNRKLVIHYCPKDKWDPSHFARLRCNLNLGFQLNSSNLEDIKNMVASIRKNLTCFDIKPFFIFQMNSTLVKRHGLESMCMFYYALMDTETDHVVFDMSGGKGKEIIVEETESFLEIMNRLDLSAALAGGLGPHNIHSLSQSIGLEYSYDAESKLRDDHDVLDMKKVNDYIRFDLGDSDE